MKVELEWIAVSDRTPRDGEYLVTHCSRSGARFTSMGDFDEGEWTLYGGYFDHTVIAWMELPEPYVAEPTLPLFDVILREVADMGIINHGLRFDQWEKDFAVVCARCGEMTTVRDRLIVDGKTAYHLACGHQNAVCVKHARLVEDGTDTSNDSVPLCGLCFGEYQDSV